MKVRTTKKCYVGTKIHEPGDEFEFTGKKLPDWMKPVEQAVQPTPDPTNDVKAIVRGPAKTT